MVTANPHAGFQGSETSGAEVTVHSQDGDPIVLAGGALPMVGRYRTDPDHSLVSVSTSKNLGGSAGTFTFTVKPARGVTDSVFERVLDDDWVDIVFSRHGRKWHVMRGLVDEVRRQRIVAGNGATTESYLVSGRDFMKIWEQTPIWFNPYTAENVGGGLSLKVFSAPNIGGSVAQTVKAFLFGFLDELDNLGRANWEPPGTLPNIEQGKFITSVQFDDSLFSDNPPRISISPSFMMPSGNAWSLAKEWSDPMFVELFAELYPRSGGQQLAGINQGDELGVDDTAMTVVVRDRPFPVVDPSLSPNRDNSLWYQLPLFVVPRQAIMASDIGRSGLERYNAFFVAPQLTQEVLGAGGIDLLQPLWSTDDILRHGLRRFDVLSRYTSPKADLLTLSETQRLKIRDWYAINPHLLNGTLQLGVGMPDIRVGTRVRIPGYASEADDETYYVETVSHEWRFGPGLRTALGVTRGWRGTETEYLQALDDLVAHYQLPPRAVPSEAMA